MILPATMLARISRNYAGKTAYHCGSVSRTWAEMNDRSGRLAVGLFSHGINKGDSVVILGKDSVEVFEHYFACMKAGFVRVSINWRYAAAEIAHVLEDCDAKVVLVQAGFVDVLRDALEIGGRAVLVERSGPVGKAMLYVRTADGFSRRQLFDATPPVLDELRPEPAFSL